MDENRPQRSRVDDVLDLLDHALQRSTESAYPTDPGNPDACWRCLRVRGEGPAGVCASCRAVLLDETCEPEDGLAQLPALMRDWMRDVRPVERGGISYHRPMIFSGSCTIQRLDGDGRPIGEPTEVAEASFTWTPVEYDEAGWADVADWIIT